MTARVIQTVATRRWAAAFAEGAVLLALLCGLVIAAAILSRPV